MYSSRLLIPVKPMRGCNAETLQEGLGTEVF